VPRVLIVDDEPTLLRALAMNFTARDYEVVQARTGTEALNSAARDRPDLIVLDLGLPDVSGVDVIRGVRAHAETPIIVLSARIGSPDKVQALDLGADDYVTKPFSVKVLLQRIKALHRRMQGEPESPEIVEHAGIKIDRLRHLALAEGKEMELTPTEFRLLECLLRQPGRAFTRAQLMDAAIGEDAVVLERTIDVHIKTLRRKLGKAGDRIQTVRGVGYRFRDNPE